MKLKIALLLVAAESAQFLAGDGSWIIEGVGVSPDVEVDNLPHATYLGEDRQLDVAVQLLQKKRTQVPVRKLQPGTIPTLR